LARFLEPLSDAGVDISHCNTFLESAQQENTWFEAVFEQI
jgi:hypothetical protein